MARILIQTQSTMNSKAYFILAGWMAFALIGFAQQCKISSPELTIEQGVLREDIGVPAMRLTFRTLSDEGFQGKIYWEIRSMKKGFVYESLKSNHLGARAVVLNGKAEQTIELLADYNEIALDEAADAEIRIMVQEEGGKEKEIWKRSQFLALPKKYAFESQYVVGENPDTRVVMKDGVWGLEVSITAKFKFTGPRIDPQRGDYFFFLNINNSTGRSLLHNYEVNLPETHTTVNKIGVNPQLSQDDRKRLNFFIPLRLLALESGERLVQVVIEMSDATSRVKFPEVFKADTPIEMPEVTQFQLQVQELELAQQDAATGAPYFGSHKPDLQWQIRVGEDVDFASAVEEGSLKAQPGEGKAKAAANDAVWLVLMDQGEEGGVPARIDRVALDISAGGVPQTLEMKDQGIFKRLKVVWIEVEKEKDPFDFGGGR